MTNYNLNMEVVIIEIKNLLRFKNGVSIMENLWFDKKGNLKVTSQEVYCNMYYYEDKKEFEIKQEIVDYINTSFYKYNPNSDIVAMYYAIQFAKETKNNYSACTLLCRNGITENADWDNLEIRYKFKII